MAYNKAAREQMGRLSHSMHEILNKAKREGRGLNSAERSKYHAMETEFSALEMETLSERSDGIEARLAMPADRRGPRIDETALEEVRDTYRASRHDVRQRTPHDKAFTNYLRKTFDGLSSDDRDLVTSGGGRVRAQLDSNVGSEGGYVVPQSFSNKLEEALKWFGGVDGVCETFTTENGAPMPYPTNDDTANVGRIIGQNTQMAQTDPVFNEVTFNAYIFSSDITLVPRALVEDSYFDLDTLLARMLATRIGRLLNTKCTVGSGSGEPQGIVPAAVAAGNIVQYPTGNTLTTNYGTLLDVEHAVDPAYRYNPSTRWMFNDAVLKVLKKLVDGNQRPLWQPGLSASFQDGAAVNLLDARPTILNHPYVINQDMAAPGVSQYSMIFGDMSKYKLRKVGDIRVQRLVERFADYLQIGYLAWLRADARLVDAGLVSGLSPIAVGQQSGT